VIAPPEVLRFAAKRALKIRTVAGYSLERPCDVYELIFHSRLELQFFAVPTLEGMYLEDGHTRRICVSAFRPPGRQRFTAAHELAHSALLHGTRVDTIKELKEKTSENDVDEESADTFAACLMMSNAAVHSGFKLRNFDVHKPTPAEVYRVATWLGVGYSTLSNHLFYSMKVVSSQHLRQLLRCEPKAIKSELVRKQTTREVFELDALWAGVSVHGRVGDLFTGVTAVSDDVLAQIRDETFVANAPGRTKCALASGAVVPINISREDYVGFYDFRYLPEEN